MSRIYDNWEKLVGAVLKREDLRQLALCESFSSSNFSSRPSFDSADPAAPSSLGISVSHNIMAIQFEEIKLATQNFQPDMLLGEGRYGPVYKGWIHEHFLTAVKPGSGIAVAVKMLNKEGLQWGIFSWSQPCHPNLVKLIGYSFEEDNGASVLVYEFMPNGSLDNHLFTRGHQLLSWETRVKVAIGAARGLSFFHDSAIMVTHEGVKSSSILLDDEFNAHFSDFDLDLTTTAPSLIHTISTPVRKDYAAPEYIAPGRLTMKSDVYSFGIILLELLSGLRVCEKNRKNLVVWEKPYFMSKRKLLQIIDSRLEGQYPHDGASKICKLAYQCLSSDPKLRPRMTEVVDALEQLSSSLSPASHYRQDPAELASGWSKVLVLGPVCRSSGKKFNPADLSSQNIFFFRNVMAIEYEEIKKATRNFQPDLLLGEGGFGRVYKGWIHEHHLTAVKPGSGIAVAVKKLSDNGYQGHEEWVDEINYLSQLHHPNMVKLIGYSSETDNRIVVYEFMARGSLENYLFRRGHQVLLWATRIKVAVDAARALAFLHDLEVPVIHRSMNCGDILLDGDFNAKLSDFGIARDGPTGDMTRGSIRVMGKYGYAAPEYVATGKLTRRCDVYAFGVVLVELISGLRVMDMNRPAKKHNLIDWARPYLRDKNRLSQIMDSRLEGKYPHKEAYKVCKIAFKCVTPDPKLRPTMVEVVAALQNL